jgi:cell division protease FtsH
MTKALLEFETLDADQIGDIMSGKPPRPPKPSGSQTPSKPASDGGAQGETAPAPSA